MVEKMVGSFEKQASEYASRRPHYPPQLFQFLASLTPHHSLAWDVGTGNGQAAIVLADQYEKVIATDSGEQQLKHAVQHPKVSYVQTSSKLSEADVRRVVGEDGSVDLVTVAQALHWMSFDTFYPLVKRVLRKPGGVLAAWTYTNPTVSPPVDAVLQAFFEITGPYWAPQRRYVDDEYRSIPFPFAPVGDHTSTGPFEFETEKQLVLHDYLEYLKTWSSYQSALEKGIELLHAQQCSLFADAWGPVDTIRSVKWRVFVLVGTVPLEPEPSSHSSV